jgi:hypothetical protein
MKLNPISQITKYIIQNDFVLKSLFPDYLGMAAVPQYIITYSYPFVKKNTAQHILRTPFHTYRSPQPTYPKKMPPPRHLRCLKRKRHTDILTLR